MPEQTAVYDWFQITKDIVIPILSLLATVAIGIVIAINLKKREQKGARKLLLIEAYMVYLGKINGFVSNQISILKQILMLDIYLHMSSYFINVANRAYVNDRLEKRTEELQVANSNLDLSTEDWSPLTFKFAFLIGKRKYDKNLQASEDLIAKFVTNDVIREEVKNKIRNRLKNDTELLKLLNSSDAQEAIFFLDRMEFLISEEYINSYKAYFDPYTTKLANVIDGL